MFSLNGGQKWTGDETSVGGCSKLLCWQYLRGFCGAAVCVCGVGSHGSSVCSSVVWLCVSGGVGCVLSGDHLFELNGEPLEFSVCTCVAQLYWW